MSLPSSVSVYFQRTTWNYILDDRNLHNHSCENPKFYIMARHFNKVTEILTQKYETTEENADKR
jgi:hypothetical protein